MPVVKYPLIGPSYKTTRSQEQSQKHLVNFYLSQDPISQDYKLVAYNTPGLKVWDNSTNALSVRGLFFQNGITYAIIDNKLYSFSENKNKTLLGTLNTSVGLCDIEGTNLQLMLNDGTYGYTYTIATGPITGFQQITDPEFYAGTTTITAQDGYFMAHQLQKFQLSGLLDGQSWDGADFASAEGDPDNLTGIKSFKRRLFLGGNVSTEVWSNTGDSFPFARIEGIFIEYGVAAANSMANSADAILWLARGKRGQLTIISTDESFQSKPVASEALAQELNTYSTVADAFAFTYQRENKEFYQITFPTVGKTWLYDITLNAWCELQSIVSGVAGRHLANCCCAAYGKVLVGDYKTGTIYELDNNTYTDNGEQILRKIVTSPLMSDSKIIRLDRLEIDIENNVGTQSGQGQNPTVMLRVSKDGGFTWGNIMTRQCGVAGAYQRRVLFGPLGASTRKPIFEITFTDPVKWIIFGAWLYAQTGRA